MTSFSEILNRQNSYDYGARIAISMIGVMIDGGDVNFAGVFNMFKDTVSDYEATKSGFIYTILDNMNKYWPGIFQKLLTEEIAGEEQEFVIGIINRYKPEILIMQEN